MDPVVVAQQRSAEEFGKSLDDQVPKLLEKYQEPGVAVALIEGCEVAWIRSYGKSDVKANKPITPRTYFQMGSISKTLTAWGVMLLVKRGKVQLDDPVQKYLRRWKLPDSEFDSKEVTVRRLLNHTAGISVPSVSGTNLGDQLPSLVDELNGTAPSGQAVKIIAKPGEKYIYSGGGYTILQMLIEDVTGKDFGEFMQDEVLKPLKMNSSYFGWNSEVEKEVATPYKATIAETFDHRVFRSLAAAGMYSTATDMATFLTKQCYGEKQEPKNPLLPRATLEEMMSGSAPSPQYGLGYQVYPPVSGVAIAGNSGSNLGWKTNFIILPSNGMGIAILTNAGEGKTRMDVFRAFRELVMQRLSK